MLLREMLNPTDSLERQNEKLVKIAESLMRRVEQHNAQDGGAYAMFERAAMLEDQVRQRTHDLEKTLDLLNESNAALAEANRETEAARQDLTSAIEALEEGFAMFSRDDKLVRFNRRFAIHLGDLQEILAPGLSFEDYITHVSQSKSLDLPLSTTREQWRLTRMARHRERHSIFNVPLIDNRWVQVSEHHMEDGRTVILQTDVTDIMRLERRAREKLLDDQAIMIRATLDHLKQGVGIFDQKGRLIGWNERLVNMLTVPASHLRFGTYFDSLHERMQPLLRLPSGGKRDILLKWVNSATTRRPLSLELHHQNGATLDLFAQEMPDRGFVISLTDVTAERDTARRLSEANELLEQRVVERTLELEQALTEAERANASKSRFVAAASHDLLQPLSAAKLYVDSLVTDERDATETAILHKAKGALESVEHIIEALLDISKLDSGTVALEKSHVPLNRVFNRLRDEFAPHAALKGLKLTIMPSSAVVVSNPTFLLRILQNLIGNAIRYTPSGRVLVGARRNGGSMRLEVWDTGPGIKPEHKELIFQEFQQLRTEHSNSEGLGLGLAIVERACHRLGHQLDLWSEPGHGAGFLVNVEHASSVTAETPPEPRAPSRPELSDFGLIVLLIENDPEVRRAITLLLRTWNASVLDVSSGAEALALLEEIQIKPDAILVDYQLDNGELGLDVITILRDRYGEIPLRLISANRSADLRRACTAMGIELMTKPLDTSRLERFLSTAIPATEPAG